MKNKLILILLTIFLVGSITGITAYTNFQGDQKDAVRSVSTATDEKIKGEFVGVTSKKKMLTKTVRLLLRSMDK